MANGAVEGDGANAITSFHIQCRVTAAGSLDFRIENITGGCVSVVIAAAMRIMPFPETPPGTLELGNCCCHDDYMDDEYQWGEIP